MLKPDHPHFISPEDAQIAIGRFQSKEMQAVSPVFALTFGADAVRALLDQKGAVALRLYHAIHDGRQTLVGAATREDGTVIDEAFIENAHPCPPFC